MKWILDSRFWVTVQSLPRPQESGSIGPLRPICPIGRAWLMPTARRLNGYDFGLERKEYRRQKTEGCIPGAWHQQSRLLYSVFCLLSSVFCLLCSVL